MPTAPKMLSRTDGSQLAYVHHQGSSPGVVFCSGFHSDMNGGKALALDAFCRANKIQFTRFDYFGHGQSSGQIENGSIGRWLSDTRAVLEQITDGPQIVVGSSMGGWLMLLAAMACPQRIQALVGIAVAADYTEDMRQRRLGPVQTRQLRQTVGATCPINTMIRNPIESVRRYWMRRNNIFCYTGRKYRSMYRCACCTACWTRMYPGKNPCK